MFERRGIRLAIGFAIMVVAVAVVLYSQSQPRTYLLDQSFSSYLADLKGRVVVLDIMNTQCLPCRVEVQQLREFHKKYGDQVELISVAIEWATFAAETDESIRRFKEEFDVRWTILRYENAREIIAAYGVYGLPTIVIIDRDGVIKLKHVGLITADQLGQAVRSVLGSG